MEAARPAIQASPSTSSTGGVYARAELGLLRLRNFSVLAEQLLFFILAERVLLLPPSTRSGRSSGGPTCSLMSLALYNVLAYCVGFARELAATSNWSPTITVADSSQIRHLAMTATNAVLQWTKAVTAMASIGFALVAVTIGRSLYNYKPSLLYVIVTFSYYMATENVFVEVFPTFLAYFEIEALEKLEKFWAPIILRLYTISLTAYFVVCLFFVQPSFFIFTCVYLNIYLRFKEILLFSWPALQNESGIVARYRKATIEEIKEFDDVCAICLSPMRTARFTPCQHLFHASCLRECLKTTSYCPICKQKLEFI